MIKNKRTFQTIGLLISILSIYWLIKTGGYNFIISNGTIGLHKGIFGHPDKPSIIISEFVFWILMLLGGLSIIKGNKLGLKIGLTTTIIGGLVALTRGIIITTHKLRYSDKALVNGTEVQMTIKEKWAIIYFEPTLYLIATTLSVIIIVLLIKRLRLTWD